MDYITHQLAHDMAHLEVDGDEPSDNDHKATTLQLQSDVNVVGSRLSGSIMYT